MRDFSLSLRPLTGAEAVLLAVVAAGFALYLWRGWAERRPLPRRMALAALRLAAAAFLAAAFLQPAVKRSARMRDAPVAVVIDGSESMSAVDAGPAGDRPRWSAAAEWIAKQAPLLDRASAPRYYVLDGRCRRADPAEWGGKLPRGAASDLSSVETAAREEPAARAVFLLTDGRHGGDGGNDFAAAAARLGVPMFPIGVGKALSAPDLVLDSVRAPHFAYKGTEVEAAVRVERRNTALSDVTVEILENGRPVAAAPLRFPPGADSAEAVLRLTPSEKGLKIFTARVPPLGVESNRRNNSRSFSMDVSRDRVRVLYICGQPGPHYAFLREQLKSNPSVDLVSFVILRDPEDAVNVPDAELSLIPFPAQDVLLQQVKTFDLLIFEQFSFPMFGISPEGLGLVREHVEKGGGLLLIGDSAILGPGSPYRRTPLEDILPVELDGLAPVAATFSLEMEGPAHPVTALEDDPSASSALWRDLPPLTGDGRLPARARPGARVLAAAQSPSGRLPVLAAWPRGKGRVMTLANLNSWQWSLGEAGRGRGAWVYQRFWNNLLRWMSSSEDFRLVRLELPRGSGVPDGAGDVWIRAFVRDEDYRPLASGEVIAAVTSPSGKIVRRTLRALGGGEFADSVPMEETGLHRVAVQAFHRQKRIGEDQGQLRVGLPWDENRDTSTDFDLLRKAARSSAGEFVPLEDASAEWLAGKLESVSRTERRSAAPWNAPAVLVLLAGALLAEWTFLRRWGRA